MISVCIIMKNEEAVLERCLKSLVSLEYEIVIADTGSMDRSKEIAMKYTDKVYDYIWQQDFAAARNFIISKSSNEYILTIDCDEFVTDYDKKGLEKLIIQNPNGIGRLLLINNYSRGNEHFTSRERISRLFSKKIYQYDGSIHEQVINKERSDNIYYDIPIKIYHEGYDGDVDSLKEKTRRNITLLERQLELNPDDPYILYQLGKSYYMQEDYAVACQWFDRALSLDLDIRLEYVQDMVESYGYGLLNSKQYDKAMQLLGVYDEFAISADFVYLIGLVYMNNARFTEAIDEFIKATNMSFHKMDGVNSYRAYYNIGVICECLGMTEKAKTYYLKCGDYKPALTRLQNMI